MSTTARSSAPAVLGGLNVYLDSLGCAKNQVDSEATLGLLVNTGMQRVTSPEDADVLLVNTCGFLEIAREESVDRILQLAQFKGRGRARVLGVMGCLVTRAVNDLQESIPEVDVWLPAGHHGDLPGMLEKIWQNQPLTQLRMATDRSGLSQAPAGAFAGFGNRVLLTPSHTAYLKLSEGCSNTCSFCSIPLMRGKQRSREISEVVTEATGLAARGVKELHLVAQDSTHYGFDLNPRVDLLDVVGELSKVDGISWLRLMYAHPKHLTRRLMEGLFDIPKLLPYLDMPIQHASDPILHAMQRPYTAKHVRQQLHWLRQNIPGIILRSTVIVGFPGETEDDFRRLCDFVEEVEYDRLGIFAYSREPDTASYEYRDRPGAEISQERLNQLTDIQLHIAARRAAARLGQQLTILVDQPFHDSAVAGDALPEWAENSSFIGRTAGEALDIDGQVFLEAPENVEIQTGSFLVGEITRADVFDLGARFVR